MGKHMTPEQRAECVTLYRNGATVDGLAAIYVKHRTIIIRLMRRHGVRHGYRFRNRPTAFLTMDLPSSPTQL